MLRVRDKDADRERVSEVLQETWESADEWFM
ncbi:DinI-like family protein [Pantoea eucrina]